MPLYEFLCQKCGARFEEICINENASPLCPECGAVSVTRQISVPGPLKKGAFPFKPGPVQPVGMGKGSACTACGHGCIQD